MALDQLGIFNDALLLIGERSLSSLTEPRETQRRLTEVWEFGAVNYCLELVKPSFAHQVVRLNSPSPSTLDGFNFSHSLPAEYVTTVGVFEDGELDQRVDRFLIQNRALLTDYDDVYLRFITNAYPIANWDPSFARVVSAYLAREMAERINATVYDTVNGKFEQRVQIAQALAQESQTCLLYNLTLPTTPYV